MGEFKRLLNRVIPLILALVLLLTSVPISATAASEPRAISDTSSTISVDGKKITARMIYLMGDGKDYVKVRDVANALKDTDKKFGVSYNSSKKTLTINPGKSYTTVGGENKKFSNNTKFGLVNDSGITVYKGTKKQSAKVFVFNKEQYMSLETLATITDVLLSKKEAKYGYIYKLDTKKGNIENLVLDPIVIKNTSGVLQNPFPNAKLNKNPKTVEDCLNIYAYLMLHNKMKYSFVVDVPYKDIYKKGGLYRIFNDAFNANNTPELFYAMLGGPVLDFTSSKGGTEVTITFTGSDGLEGTPLAIKLNEYFTKTQAAVQSLIDSGAITKSMSETEKAYQIYKWVALNVAYDYESLNEFGTGILSMDNSGYNAIVKKKAVCTGYTGLYNLMCRFVGLYDIQGIVGNDKITEIGHLWSLQVLDGKKVMTDATWGNNNDGGKTYDEDYFANSAEYFKAEHLWSSDSYSKWNSAPGIDRAIINNISGISGEISQDEENTAADDIAAEESENE